MYFQYIVNWFYRLMNVPVPLVLSRDVYSMVSVFDIFLFLVYLGVFVILIKYLITDSLNLGATNINYSSSAYLPRNMRQIGHKTKNKKESADNVDNN